MIKNYSKYVIVKSFSLIILILFSIYYASWAQDAVVIPKILSFGEGGQIKMLYDRRQRPPSLFMDGKVFIVFNAGGKKGAPARSPTKPMAVTFDPINKQFSETIVLGSESKDHHDGPVIWADEKDHIHVLYGCHSSPGTHLISRKPKEMGTSLNDWITGSQLAPKISYPTVFKISGNRQLIYYRTAGHISSWTYRISGDNGKSWTGPPKDVVDLDSKGRFEWSSYQCKLPSKDGKYLHVVFTAYDDNRQDEPDRYYNARYKKAVSNEWKYNLYYIKIDLNSDEVLNHLGEKMETPIDLDQANSKCMIWDTEGRGAGVPPDIVLDQDGNPGFLHVLSEETTERHNYYFIRLVKGEWVKNVIAPSNHQWNSCHLQLDAKGTYRAYLVVGEVYMDTQWVEGKSMGDQFKKGATNYINTGGYMDKHGGGRIEEWTSSDGGFTWKKHRDINPDPTKYDGWKFNNIQPVTYRDGSIVDGMLLFYGWKDKNAPEAKAFLGLEDRDTQTDESGINQLSAKEKKQGWELLFDGKSTKGWRGTYVDHFPTSGWEVKNGNLCVIPSFGEAKKSKGGSIITAEQFNDFELYLECKFQAGINSGIKYFVQEIPPVRPGKGLGLEYQIWDDYQERDANKKMACLYDLIVAENKIARPVGSYNAIRIKAKGKRVEHWLNGKKVLSYKRGSKRYHQLIAQSKYKDIPTFGEAKSGHILLQDEGGPGICFRNIKIRKL